MLDILLHYYELINYHDIVCQYVYVCCELASTFNVLTWRVMPDFRKALLEWSYLSLDCVHISVPVLWSSATTLFRCRVVVMIEAIMFTK